MKEGWEVKLFEELIDAKLIGIVRNARAQSPENSFRYFKMSNIKNDNGFNDDCFTYVNASEEEVLKYSLLNNDFLFNTRNSFELVGKTCLYKSKDYDRPTLFNNNLLRVRFKTIVLTQFVAYAFSAPSVLNDLEKMKSGTTSVIGIYYKSLRNLPIPIPPLSEQKQIVAILDKAFEAIDKAKANIEKNIENAKELFQSKLNEIFSQRGEGWEEKTLGEIGKVSMCKRVLKRQTSISGAIPFYKIGTFGKKPNAFITNELYQDFLSKYSFPKKGDILLSASGTIGRRVIYNGKPGYFQDSNIVWIDNDEELVLNRFLYHFYGMCNWNPSKGATISRLYNDDLRRIKILFPNKNQQIELAINIDRIHGEITELDSIYVRKIEALDELKKSLLQKAFAGELT